MEMIIQNETGNFTLHVRISDSKEYDFLKDVTELARKYDFENDDFEIEDPEKETDQVPETTISEAVEEYSLRRMWRDNLVQRKRARDTAQM